MISGSCPNHMKEFEKLKKELPKEQMCDRIRANRNLEIMFALFAR